MMKDEEVLATKSLWMLALVLCLCLGAASAAGAEADALARDITGQCLFNGRESITDLEDGNYRTFWTSHRQEGAHCLMVSAPEAVGGVLVRWRNPAPLAAQVKQDGEWVTVAQSDCCLRGAVPAPAGPYGVPAGERGKAPGPSWRSAR